VKAEVNENALSAGGMINLFDPSLYTDGGYWNGVDIVPLPEWVKVRYRPRYDRPHVSLW
jgi:hypothetical protein